MNEQKLSRIAAIIYGLAAVTLILVFTVCGSSPTGITVQTSAQGYKGAVTVEVTVAGEKITAAQLVSSEDSDFTKPVIEGIIAKVVKKGGAAGVDVVAGATYSSKAVLEALDAAVKEVNDF